MNNYHLRFTPYDISGYSFEWLKRYNKHIVAQEDVEDDGTPLLHFHILIVTDNAKDTVRDMAKARLRIPSVNGKGKNNKYYALIPDWKDPGYICKYDNIIQNEGYTEKELMDFVKSGKEKYLNKVEKTPAEHSVTAVVKAKSPRIPYQQDVIARAYADWINYKKKCKEEGVEEDRYEVIDMVCKAMREVSKSLNEYLIRDICNAVLYDDPEWRNHVLRRLKSNIKL